MELHAGALAGGEGNAGPDAGGVPVRHWAERYVGLPFSDGGRSIDGLDCWGLIRLVLSEQRGIEVPSYGAIPAKELAAVARMMTVSKEIPPWTRVDQPRAFDILTMFARAGSQRAICHVGIMLDEGRVLHIEKATHSVAVLITHPSISFRMDGFYRHERLL